MTSVIPVQCLPTESHVSSQLGAVHYVNILFSSPLQVHVYYEFRNDQLPLGLIAQLVEHFASILNRGHGFETC